MIYLLAFVFPPAVLFRYAQPISAIINFLIMLTGVGWIFSIVWALVVINQRQSDKRTDRIV